MLEVCVFEVIYIENNQTLNATIVWFNIPLCMIMLADQL